MAQEDAIAPEYRYFMADLLTNEVLAEIPFGSVSYERAIKGAGTFSGSIPVIADTENFGVYENTMPGRTALYVVRDNICVWGGIVWSRKYDVVQRVLQISASEFTSYFYHRRIWKTFNHEYGATVTVADGQTEVVFDNGSTSSLVGGAVVKLAFDPANATEWKYDGYYTIDDEPAPTTDTFYIEGSQSLAKIEYITRASNTLTVETKNPHGFHTGDKIEIYVAEDSRFNGTYTITVNNGLTTYGSNDGPKTFTCTQSGADVARTTIVTGEATRGLPDGIYHNVTVSVRADTYDYIRNLIDAVFKDFVGIDFPNTYIEPGVTYEYDIIQKELGGGYATIKTSKDHNAVVGQAVQIKNLSSAFDGEFEIVAVPYDDVFVYKQSGTLPQESASPKITRINKVKIVDGTVTVTTTTPHEFEVGQTFVLETGIDAGGVGPLLNGSFVVDSIANRYKFRYVADKKTDFDEVTLKESIVTLNGSPDATNLITNPSGETAGAVTVARTNYATNPSMETSSGAGVLWTNLSTNPTGTAVNSNATTIYRRNLVLRPSVEVDATDYATNAGTGGTATGARTVATSPYGTAFYRATWTVATTAPSGFIEYNGLGTAGAIDAGTTYTFSAYVRASKAQKFSARIQWRTSAGMVSSSSGPVISAAANTWVRVYVTATAAATADRTYLDIDVDAATGSTWSIGSTMDVDGLMLEASDTLRDYFDGSIVATKGFTNSWSGTANITASNCTGDLTAYAERTNLVINPASGTNVTGYTAVAGTGGTAAVTQGTAASVLGTPAYAGAHGPTFARTTWSVASTAIGTGGVYYTTPTTLTAGTTYSVAAYARVSRANQRVQLSVQWLAGATVLGTAVVGTQTVLTFNVWTRLTLENLVAPATATAARIQVLGVTGTSGRVWAISDVLDMDSVQMEVGTTIGTYFDGTSSTTGDRVAAFTGTAHASTSVIAYRAAADFGPNTAATAVLSDVGSGLSKDSVKIIPIDAANNGSYVSLRLGTVASNNLIASGKLAVNKTYTVKLRMTLTAPLTGTLNSNALSIYYRDVTNSTITVLATAPNVAGSYDLSGSFTVASNAANVELRVMNGAALGGGYVWVDNILVTEGGAPDTYFDGTTAAYDMYSYAWTGTAYLSTSTKSVSQQVTGWVGNSYVKVHRSPNEAYIGSYSLGIYYDGLVAAQGAALNVGLTPQNNATYTASIWVKGTYQDTVSLVASELTAGAAVVTTASSGYLTLTGEWQRLSVSITVSSGAASNFLWLYVTSRNSVGSPYTVYADALLVEKSTKSYDYFDGNTVDTVSDYDYAWSGTAHASTSTLSAVQVASLTAGSDCLLIQSGDWDMDGTKSIRIIPTSQTGTNSYIQFTLPTITSGQKYTIMGVSRQREPLTGTMSTIGDRQIVVVESTSSTTNYYKSTSGINSDGETSHVLHYTVGAGTTGSVVRWYNGASEGNGDVWWDNLLVVAKDYSGPYFDGDTDTDNGYTYDWTGTAHASTSTRRAGANVVTSSLTANTAKLTTEESHVFAVGDVVTVKDVTPEYQIEYKSLSITEKYNNQAGVATITTTTKHQLQSGDTVVLSGLQDSSDLSTMAIAGTAATKTVTLNTATAHNFIKGQTVTIDADDQYQVIQKSLTNNVATIKTSVNPNIPIGTSVTVANIIDDHDIASVRLVDNAATITLTSAHNYAVNDTIVVRNIQDSANVSVKECSNGVVTLTTQVEHNFDVGTTVFISGMGEPFDGEVKVKTATATKISYEISSSYADKTRADLNKAKTDYATWKEANPGKTDSKQEDAIAVLKQKYNSLLSRYANMYPTTASGAKIKSKTSVFNGEHQISSKGNTTLSFTYKTARNDVASRTVSNGTYSVTNKEATDAVCILTSDAADTVSVGEKITVSGIDARFNGTYRITAVDESNNKISYRKTGAVVNSASITAGTIGVSPKVTGYSPFNGTYTVTALPDKNKFSYAKTGNNVAATDVYTSNAAGIPDPTVTLTSVHSGDRVLTAATRTSISFTQKVTNPVTSKAIFGKVSAPSVFNGTKTVVGDPTAYTFKFQLKNQAGNISETVTNSTAIAKATSIYNGTALTITKITSTSISYAVSHVDMSAKKYYGLGTAQVYPVAKVSTFGPYPNNSNIGINFSTSGYSGKNVTPTLYRGFEIKNVGEALSTYSDSIDGFEYRIDCSYDQTTDTFTKTFVMVPIDFPDPPAAGEISPISRFGADKLVFEYPGNIINVSLDETAERSSTRFFAVGENDLGPNAGPPFSVASAVDLLDGSTGRRWPLLDDDESIKGIDDEAVLYAYAQRYLTEGRPPAANITVSVNGSLRPVVGSYNPGDWCSIIVDDWFIRQRLLSDMEPRDTVIVRKIDAIKVRVPDGTTFPEQVELVLVPEWEVDKRG